MTLQKPPEKPKDKILDEKLAITKAARGYFYAERYSTRARRWVIIGRRKNIPDLEKMLDKNTTERMLESKYLEIVQYVEWIYIAGAELTKREKRMKWAFPALRHFTMNKRTKIIEKN